MKVLSTKILRGPNYWSNKRQELIEMKMDIGKYEYLPTNMLQDFANKLKKLMPSLYYHHCSPRKEGGFYLRMDEGTWLGHVIEHVALELQELAGMKAGFGRTYGPYEPGIYYVIYTYELENAGIYAGKVAIDIVKTLAEGKNYTKLEKNLATLKNIYMKECLGPSTKAIVEEAKKRQIPYKRLDKSSLITLGHGIKQKKIWATVTSNTSAIGVDIVANKELTKQILIKHFIPVPNGQVISNLCELKKSLKELNYPLVIKPLNGNHGRGITCNLKNATQALNAFKLAKNITKDIIIEEFIQGNDYRFLVINYKLVAVAKRMPAKIIGDGNSTIQELIDITNQDPRRGENHENYLTKIKIDKITLNILQEHNLSLNDILPKDKILYLKHTANLSSGGTPVDVSDAIHPQNIQMAERIARIVNLDICGIDIVCEDITKAINNTHGAIIEVNACPGLRMHLACSKTLNVAKIFLDTLFPNPKDSRIPIVAVTGTNGKTTVVRFIAHMAKVAGLHVGFTTTDGIYINNELIYHGDCSGPKSAALILEDSLVNYAVLECARGGILREGLAFRQSDISIITNITPDHLGIENINTIEELKEVKAVVARSTHEHGCAILNADDDLVYSIKADINCKVALFALQETTRIREHCANDGLAAFTDKKLLIVQKGKKRVILGDLTSLPITFQGEAQCMIKNLLAVTLAGIVSNFSYQQIKDSIKQFVPSAENTPGRMNLFDFNNFKIMIDYAHNQGAFLEIGKYLNSLNCTKKIGIIGAVGDRRPEDIVQLGFNSAKIFDEIIIRHNSDGRGRTNQQLTDLIMQGIKDSNKATEVKVISDECAAMKYAMDRAEPDSFIFHSADCVHTALNFVNNKLNTTKALANGNVNET